MSTELTNGTTSTDLCQSTSSNTLYKIPPEIRTRIWLYAARADARILEVHWDPEYQFTFHSHPSSLLLVNKEAYSTTRDYYRREIITYRSRCKSYPMLNLLGKVLSSEFPSSSGRFLRLRDRYSVYYMLHLLSYSLWSFGRAVSEKLSYCWVSRFNTARKTRY